MVERTLNHWMVVLLALLAPLLVVALPSNGTVSGIEPVDEIVAYVVEGTGNGHGRGLSQWGAYGWAVEHGKDWEWILDHYYGGTEMGDIELNQRIRVRLTDFDGAAWLGVISESASAAWQAGNRSGSGASAIKVVEVGVDRFDVFEANEVACPSVSMLTVPDGPVAKGSEDESAVRQIQIFLTAFGWDPEGIDGKFGPQTEAAVRAFQIDNDDALDEDGIWKPQDAQRALEIIAASVSAVEWEPVAESVKGPVVIATSVDESSAEPESLLGLCSGSGSVTHYRGNLELLYDNEKKDNRVVNDVLVENYLRGVVPREVSASWGDRGDGAGMNALRAQAVAARSYGVVQSRYGYAGTCDTSSCQVYGGAATRVTPSGAVATRERPQTDIAISETAGKVRRWMEGNLTDKTAGEIVSTEFSASNGPQTAGGYFPSVPDAGDAVALNPNHRWTRIISREALVDGFKHKLDIDLSGYDLSRVTTVVDPESSFVGIYANRVRIGSAETDGDEGFVDAWDFRNAFGLPSPGFTLAPLLRSVQSTANFAFIGDSVGESVSGEQFGQELPLLLDGVFPQNHFDAKSSRRTVGGSIEPDGVGAANLLPVDTDLVIVELGYNDEASAFSDRIDEMMSALVARGVSQVAWTTMSERRLSGDYPRYASSNEALRDARGRWPQLIVLDWDAASDAPEQDRWYSDGVHLSTTGQAQFALWLRDEILSIADPSWVNTGELEHFVPVSPKRMLDTRTGLGASKARRVENGTIEISLAGEGPLPGTGVEAVWVNVTAVDGQIGQYGGFVTAFPCGTVPFTSTLNFEQGQTVANSALVRLSDTGSICLYVFGAADLLVDVFGYLPDDSPFVAMRPERVIDTRIGLGSEKVGPLVDSVLEFNMGDIGAISETKVSALVVNITVDQTMSDAFGGFVTAYPCGEEPETSSLNFFSGQVVANAAIVPVAEDDLVCFAVDDEAQLIVDVIGVLAQDSGFNSMSPRRIVDTRGDGKIGRVDGSGAPLEIQVVEDVGLASGKRVIAASLNLTVDGTVASDVGGFTTVYPCGVARPFISNQNFTNSNTVAGGVVTPVDKDGRICVYVYGIADVIVDLNGLITS